MSRKKISALVTFGVIAVFFLGAFSSGLFNSNLIMNSNAAMNANSNSAVIKGVNGIENGEYSDKIDKLVLEELEENEFVDVIISIKDDGEIPSDSTLAEDVYNQIGQPERSMVFEEYAVFATLNDKEIKEISKHQAVEGIYPDLEAQPVLVDSVNIINVDDVWELESEGMNLDGTGTTACLTDFGVDFSHPDLKDKDILGGNLVCGGLSCELDSSFIPTNDHGTKMAGMLAANGGAKGIGKGMNIISLYTPGTSSWNKAVRWCRDNAEKYNITVISTSLGFGVPPPLYSSFCDDSHISFKESVRRAFDEAGIYTVAAAGNDGSSEGIIAPACLSNVIAAGATDKEDYRANPGWWGSNYKEGMVKLFAPGTDIEGVPTIGGKYEISHGTSASTPMVAASIAIASNFMKMNDRSKLSIAEMEDLFFRNGDIIHDLDPEHFKRINVYNAIMELDSGAPEIRVTSPLAGRTYYGGIPLKYNVNDEMLESCWYTLNDVRYDLIDCGEGDVRPVTAWLNATSGNNTVILYAIDQLGKESGERIDFEVGTLGPGEVALQHYCWGRPGC